MARRRGDFFLLGFFILLCVLIDTRISTRLDIDSHRYLELGQRLYDNGALEYKGIDGELHPDFSRTPVYPMLIAGALALFEGESTAAIEAVIWLQRFAWMLAVGFALPGTRRADGGWRIFTLVGKIVLLFSPLTLLYGSLLLTDLLYTAGLLVGLRMFTLAMASGNRRDGLWTGFVHGLLTLVRPFHLYAPLVMVVPWLRRRPRVVFAIIVMCMSLPLLWMARNAALGSSWTLSTVRGRSLALHQEKTLREMPMPEKEQGFGQIEFLRELKATDEGPYTAAWILMRDYGISESESDAIAGRAAFRAILYDPLAYAGQVLRNFRRLLWSPADGRMLLGLLDKEANEQMRRIAGWIAAGWGMILFFVVPGILLVVKIPRRIKFGRPAISFYLIAAYLAVVPALTTVTYGRFALPLLPLAGYIYCWADVGRRREDSS